MARLFIFVLLLLHTACSAQKKIYTTANAHSHNDYEQSSPFYLAWRQGFGSIEADIWLRNGQLLVAHDTSQLSRDRTLDSLYLQPLVNSIQKNSGHIYADKSRSLQLMIDIKSEAISTLDKLVETLQKYPSLINTPSLKIVISGSRPSSSDFSSYPSWIRFDGELRRDYQPRELEKIEMLSDNFARYSSWKGKGELPENEKKVLQQFVDRAHALGKKIRFWNAPDMVESWTVLKELGVDYINTDKIDELSRFLKPE